jgi:hypothetical protein
VSIGFSFPTCHRSQPADAPMCLCRHCRVCYSSYRMEKNGPPPGIATNDEDVRRWRIMVRVARMWVLTVAIAKMRISASRFKVGTDRQTAGAPPLSPLPGSRASPSLFPSLHSGRAAARVLHGVVAMSAI